MGAVHSSLLKDVLKDLTVDTNEVDETGAEVLGSGAYGKVAVVRFNGLRCASKTIHDTLTCSETYQKDGGNMVIERFVEECKQLSQIRHPNIVQFLGVYFNDSHMPSLLMELLPINLGDFLDEYQNVPDHVKNSILLDVSLGLLYMHKHKPLMLHRDLTVNNVLLTRSLNAKITDLGMVKVLDVHPKTSSQSPFMTICPGSSVCMPPEACSDNPIYNEKLDVFSFGHMIVHVVIQKWPMPLNKYTSDLNYTMCRTEVQRREKFIAEMEDKNPLKPLALKCLQDDPVWRPQTEEVVREMEHISSKTPLPFSNPIELLQALERPTIQRKELSELKELLAARGNEIYTLQQKIEKLEVQLKEQAKISEDPIIPDNPPPVRNLPTETKPIPVPKPRVANNIIDVPLARPREPFPVPRPRMASNVKARPHEASNIPDTLENEIVTSDPNIEEQRPIVPHSNTGFSYLPPSKFATMPRVARKPPGTTATPPGDAPARPPRAEDKQGTDPKLAALLARQKQKAEGGVTGEGYNELEETRRRVGTLSKQVSSGGSEPLTELQRLFERRRNKNKQ